MTEIVQYCGGKLVAFPAVHYVARFAAAVNSVFKGEQDIPRVVAVELGQGTVDEIVKWFQELGVGPDTVTRLPSMLGLTRRNQLIHPKFRDMALALQREHGLPLHELPADVKSESLEFADSALICLSPTDSIVESIRSAVERGIPVFGVDLEEYSNTNYRPFPLEDPRGKGFDADSYAASNASYASRGFDPHVDARREAAMIAWLKRLLEDFGQVLFTGGLAHWNRLSRGVHDPSIPAAASVPQTTGLQYQRTIVGPSIAVRYMDVLPEVTTRYEEARFLPVEGIDADRLYEGLLRGVLETAFEVSKESERCFLPGWVQYLSNHCLMNQWAIPPLFECANSAKVMVSDDFSKRLGTALLRKNIEWAHPSQWPGLPYLSNDDTSSSGVASAKKTQSARLSFPDRPGVDVRFVPPEGQEGISIDGFSNDPDPEPSIVRRGYSKVKGFLNSFGECWAWHPRENLLYATAYQAAGFVFANFQAQRSQPFEGSLMEGLDTKATLRSYAKGENRFYVRSVAKDRQYTRRDALHEPAVMFFGDKEDFGHSDWDVSRAAAGLTPYVTDVEKYQRIKAEKGGAFIANIAVSERRSLEPRLEASGGFKKYLWGTTTFGNPCNNVRQAARWAEWCNYEHFPILRSASLGSLLKHYRKEHGIKIDIGDWRSALIKMAIPYARRRVVVVAPSGYTVPLSVLGEAGKRKVEIKVVPLSQFPEDQIEKSRNQYFLYGLGNGGLECPPEIEEIMGETCDSYTELLPEWIRNQRRE